MQVEELIEAASAATDLSNFGNESFRVGLETLTTCLGEEGRLSEMGNAVARGHLLRLLENRLGIEDWYARHPEIAAGETPAPIFILGLPRTGSTALSTRLARDPAIRSVRGWESSAPIPPPRPDDGDDEPRLQRARAEMEAMHSAFPLLKKMYDATPTDPTECQDLLGMEFATHHFAGQYRVPGYAAWLLDQDMTPAYRYHQRTLKLLQWRCPPNLWHLKTPLHMLSLDALNRVYPDARFLMTHRDPASVLGSVCALIEVTRTMASDDPDRAEIGREQLDLWPLAVERAMRFRESVGEERFADVFFTEQLSDPVGVMERSYEKLGLVFSDETRAEMESWAATHTRGRQGSYTYRLEDYGLDVEVVRERFAAYIDHFAIEGEKFE